MTTLVASPTIGLERIQRETVIILMEVLNDAMVQRNEAWHDADEELADKRGVPFVPILLEPVLTENFHLGHRPSLIDAPIEGYPNVSAMADRAVKAEEGEFDQIAVTSNRLWIEIMVKSDEEPPRAEEEVNARVQRMADAVNICMMSNPTLRGIVNQDDGLESIEIGVVMPREEDVTHGKRWYWQGARLEYLIRKESQHPIESFAQYATESPSNIGGIDVDQSP